jgi:citrate lyase subunit beta / citryl-CoA lyase
MKLSRSFLFVPAKKWSMIEKAVESSADSVIIDLEDAIAISEKEQARELAGQALNQFTQKKSMYLRINDMTTCFWEDDLSCAIVFGAAGIILPKAESPQEVFRAAEILRKCNETLDLIAIIETAAGVQFSYEIASCHPLVSRLAFGSIDYALDMDLEFSGSGTELLYARSQIAIASRVAKILPPIDSVYPNLQDEQGLLNESRQARQLGFKGKLAIHPKQLAPIHHIFTPSEVEINEARTIVEAFEQAEKQGIASLSVSGKLVDYPVYRKAKGILLTVS